jgi:pimeloyl-ACP methyl ester carboxylesterase
VKYLIYVFIILVVFTATSGVASVSGGIIKIAQDTEPLGIAMENYDYPYEVKFMELSLEGEDVRMAFMDIQPISTYNGENILLLHGKNFFGAYWKRTIEFLAVQGYRVIVPDQVGFGKSSKPDIQYSFHLLARNTKQLLEELDVDQVTVVGHSMGGMLATRFALMYPQTTKRLVLENPIGLEDYRLKVPYTSVHSAYENILGYTEKSIRDYHKTYYVKWEDKYEEYVQVHYRWTLSGEYPRLAWVSAKTFEMVYSQPVLYEFPNLTVLTLLIIGQEDRTTLGRGQVTPEVLATLGQYPELGEKTAASIPDCTLIEMHGVGHIPHLEAFEFFQDALINFLNQSSR